MWEAWALDVLTPGFPGPPGESGTAEQTQVPQEADTMKATITRLITAGAIVLVFLASACIGPSPTDPGGSKGPEYTVPGDPPDEVIKN